MAGGINRRQLKIAMAVLVALTVLLTLGFLSAVVFVEFHNRTNSTDVRSPEALCPPEEQVPDVWRENCQYLEMDVSGDEGEQAGMKLRAVAVLFRHGERSPVDGDNLSENGCAPHRQEDRDKFDDYVRQFHSSEFKKFIHFDSAYDSYVKLPERSRCVDGQLTAEGALQHLRLGKFMHERYATSNLFKDPSNLHVEVVTTDYNRTFQSGVAFTTGFLYPLKEQLATINVKKAFDASVCDDESCRCEHRHEVREQTLYGEFLDYYKKDEQFNKLRDEHWPFTHYPPYKGKVEPFKFMDVSMGCYICRHKPLPCFDGKRVTFELLNKLYNTTSERTQMMLHNSSYVARKVLLTEGYGVLSGVKRLIEQNLLKTEADDGKKFIKIFSAHDSTVGPNLAALDIPFGDFPHYCSRLVFEIYELQNEGVKFVMRILYQGRDVTEQMKSCRSRLVRGMCPVEEFIKHVDGIVAELKPGAKTITEFCESPEYRKLIPKKRH